MTVELENGPPPEWMIALENKKRNHTLAHEIGAGAPCLKCNEGCSGLDLHFWRKICRNCKCKKEQHDVKEESSVEQFEILFGENFRGSERVKKISLNLKGKLDDIFASRDAAIKENSKTENDVSFDWIPADVPPSLASEYLQQLPADKLPITGSAGAMFRREQLQKQIPLHDFKVKNCHDLTDEETLAFTQYVDNLKNNAVGQGLITKIMPSSATYDAVTPKQPMFSHNLNSTPKPFKSFSSDNNASEFPSPPPASDLHFPSADLKTPSAFVPYRKLNANLTPLRNSDESWDTSLPHEYASLPHHNTSQPLHTSLPHSTQPISYNQQHPTSSPVDRLTAQYADKLSVADRNLRNLDSMNNNANDISHGVANINSHHGHSIAGNNNSNYGRSIANNINSNNGHSISGNHNSSYGPSIADNINSNKGHSVVGNSNSISGPTIADNINSNNGHGIAGNIKNSDNHSIVNNINQQTNSAPVTSPVENLTPSQIIRKFNASQKPSPSPAREASAKREIFRTPNTFCEHSQPFAANAGFSSPLHSACADASAAAAGHNVDAKYSKLGNPEKFVARSSYVPNRPQLSNALSTGVASPMLPLPRDGSSLTVAAGTAAASGMAAAAGMAAGSAAAAGMATGTTAAAGMAAGTAAAAGMAAGTTAVAGMAAGTAAAAGMAAGTAADAGMLQRDRNQNPRVHFGETMLMGGDEELLADPGQQLVPAFGSTVIHPETYGSGNEVDDIDISCHQCKVTVQPGQVVVVAERAGHESIWHPQCFVCVICQELLVDLVYFFHRGDVYCGRHYAEVLKIPRCFACDELIFLKEYTVAEGQTFHFKHFCCYECDIPLADKSYVPKDGNPVCLPCYELKYSKRCNCCGDTIKAGDSRVGWKDLSWHATASCFKCVQCLKSLLGGRFVVRSDNPLCSKECIIQFDLNVG